MVRVDKVRGLLGFCCPRRAGRRRGDCEGATADRRLHRRTVRKRLEALVKTINSYVLNVVLSAKERGRERVA